MSTQKEVVVTWDAAGLRAEPVEIEVNSRQHTLRWELISSRRGARISRITFAEGDGPFASIAGADDSGRVWEGTGSREEPYGRRYKYSVFVADSKGEVELDPFIVETDKP